MRRNSSARIRPISASLPAVPGIVAPDEALDRGLDAAGELRARALGGGGDLRRGELRRPRRGRRQSRVDGPRGRSEDRKSTRLNSSHANISYAVFCLKKKNDDFRLQLTNRR